jgi:hypothetical protein
MFNFIKKKTIELHLYTNSVDTYNLLKPRSAKDFYPEWYKNLPKIDSSSHNITPTLKSCYGFMQLYKKSFIIPLWADLKIETIDNDFKNMLNYDDNSVDRIKDKRIQVSFCSDNHHLQMHDKIQYKNLLNHDKHTIVKLETPWRAYCSEDIDFHCTNAFYNNADYMDIFTVVPGMMSFKFQYNMNIFICANKNKDPTVLNFGMPLAMLTPLTDRPIKIIYHLDPLMCDSLNNVQRAFSYDIFRKKLLHKRSEKN